MIRIVPVDDAKRFAKECLVAAGAVESHALQLAEVLIAADHRGHFSHGINRLGMYATDVKLGAVGNAGEPQVLNETPATAWVDGRNLLGPVVGNFCMDLAIQKAKSAGVGLVSVKGSNHFGIAGWYSMQAMRHNLMGLSFTNGSPIAFPSRAAKRFTATNPVSLAAEGQNGDSFVLDMATSTVAYGKVEIAHRKGQKEIPPAWGADKRGRETRNPEEVLDNGGMLPLGGKEITSGYKGSGLMIMIEILCGILSGSKWGWNIRKWGEPSGPADLGHCFIAIDPEAFAPDFSSRLQEFMDVCRSLPPVEPELPVLVPGDPERTHMKKCEGLGGIPYHENQIKYTDDIAKEWDITPLLGTWISEVA